jgi:hypothetical protein
MSTFAVASRIVLVVIFCVSAAGKAIDRNGTLRSIREFRIPSRLVAPVFVGLVTAETAVVFALLFSTATRFAAVAAILLLTAFTVTIAASLRRGETPACNCFGQLTQVPVSRRTLLRNVIFALPAVALIVIPTDKIGPTFLPVAFADSASANTPRIMTAALICVLMLLSASVVHLANANHQLGRSVDDLRSELELSLTRSDPRAVAPESGLPVGVLAPNLEIETANGERLPVLHVLATTNASEHSSTQHQVLLFASASCRPCQEVMRTLERSNRSVRDRVLVVLPGTPETGESYTASHRQIRFAFTGETALAALYNSPWTPAAVAVSGDGRIATRTRYGTSAITKLFADLETGSLNAGVPFVGGQPDQAKAIPKHPTGTVVVYWRSTCPHCEAFSPELSAWITQRSSGAPEVVFLVAAARDITDPLNREVVIDSAGSIATGLGLSGTPSAVLLDADGVVRSQPCVGADAIRLLLGSSAPSLST